MQELLRDIVTGSVSGAIYALIAAGLVLTYASTGIFNLGYAGISFSAAYLFFELNTGLGWPQWLAAGLVILVYCPLLGLAARRGDLPKACPGARGGADRRVGRRAAGVTGTLHVHRRTRHRERSGGRSPPAPTCSSCPGPRSTTAQGVQPLQRCGDHLGPDHRARHRGPLLSLLLAVFLRSTQTGLRMRAVADRHDLASMRGINDARTSQLAWVLGTMLAGIAGVVGSPILRALDPNTYALAVFVAIAAAVVGGFRSVGLAFVGAHVRCGGEQPHLHATRPSPAICPASTAPCRSCC